MNRLPKRQPLSRLCSDDIIRNPANGRLVRLIDSGDTAEKGNRYTYFNARYVDDNKKTQVVLGNRSTVVVYID